MRTLLLGLSLIACTTPPLAPLEPAPAAVASRAVPAAAPLLGVVAARTSEVVAARIDGRIVRVSASTGQRIRAGDLLAELDPTLLADRLRAATAAVDAARAEAAGATAEVAEGRRQVALEQRMFAAGATAQESVRIARARLARAVASSDRAAAGLRQADAARAAIESQLSYTRLVAPIDGVVSLVKAQPGEVVAPGAAIARVFDPAHLMIRFQVTRERRREITGDTIVELAAAGAARPLRARVTSVSSDLEPPLDFAIAEADITDADIAESGPAHSVPIGTLVDVTIAASK